MLTSMKVKFTELTQTLGRLQQSPTGILSQTAGPAGKLWVSPVEFRLWLHLGVLGRQHLSAPHQLLGRGRRGGLEQQREDSAAAPPLTLLMHHTAGRIKSTRYIRQISSAKIRLSP